MREIKFRAWNVRDKIMEYDVDVIKGKPVMHGYQWFNTENIETVYHSPLQQYTGLKDRNGREIYEGDIVKGRYYDNFSRKEFDIVCIVRWDKSGYWTFDGRDIRFTGGYLTDLRYIEVIGNIYENPELLEAEGNEQP